MRKMIYFKGGRAIEEAHRLFSRVGELPNGGPDKFLLAVLYYSQESIFRLASLGPKTVKISYEGKEVVEYEARSASKIWIIRRLAFLKSILFFLKDGFSFRPNIILCGVDGPFAFVSWILSLLTNARFVFLAHNSLNLPSIPWFYRVANKLVCGNADSVIAHGPFVKNEVVHLGANESVVTEFNNGLDPEHFDLLKSLLNTYVDSDENIILYVGRIEENKGVFDLLNAFLRLNIKSQLWFVGEGAGTFKLELLIQENKVQDCVRVIGAVSFEQVFKYMHQASVVVTPSQSKFPEGFCKSAMESFYTGTPVIAPNYGPFPYMIEHESNGLLYEPDSIESLSFALSRFFTEDNLKVYLSAGAKKSGEKFMNPKITFAAAIKNVLNSEFST